MKYMIIMTGSQQHYDAMAGRDVGLPVWSPEQITAMVGYMHELNTELENNGELVDAQGLSDPAHGRRVQLKNGVPVITDGPYAETAEVLAGYWVVECDSLDRATEIATRAAQCPVPDGFPTDVPVDIRPVGEAPEGA